MAESRGESRCMCSELVNATWDDVFGRRHEAVVNLEEVWARGATLQFEAPVRAATRIRIDLSGLSFDGRVSKCAADFVGFLVEVEFAAGQTWSRELYEPNHFFDPRTLAASEALKKKNQRLLEECTKNLPHTIAR